MNKTISVVITAALVIIITGSVLVPIITDAQDTQRTVYNNDISQRYSELFNGSDSILDQDIELYVESFTDNTLRITKNGAVSTLAAQRYQGTLLMCDAMNIRWDPGNGNFRMSSDTIDGSISQTNLVAPLTITIDNGIITVTDSSDTPKVYTATPTKWLFIPNDAGEWETILESSGNFYLNGLDQVYFSTNSNTIGFYDGNGGELEAATGVYSWTFDGMEKDDRYTDLYVANLSQFTVDDELGEIVGDDFVPFQVIIPRSVDAHTEANISALALLGAIPVIILISLVASIALIFRRDN